LRNYKSVAAAFPLSQRNDKLTFTHHAAVQSLKEKGPELLTQCVAENWSKAEFNKAVRMAKKKPDDKPKPDPEPDPTDDEIADENAKEILTAFMNLGSMLIMDENSVKDACDYVWNNRDEILNVEEGAGLFDALKDSTPIIHALIEGLRNVEQKIRDEKTFDKKRVS
jgi:hypothetical protein